MPITKTELNRSIRKTRKQIDNFYKSNMTQLQKWTVLRAELMLPSYIRAIEAQSWDSLARIAQSELKARRLERPEMKKCQENIISHRKWLDTIATEATPGIVAFHKNWTAFSTVARQSLLDRGLTSGEVEKTLDRFKSFDQLKMRQDLMRGVEGARDDLNRALRANLAATMGATIALAIAQLNQNVKKGSQPPTTPEAFCTQTTAALVRIETTLWNALRSADLSTALVNAENLVKKGETALLGDAIKHAAKISVTRGGSHHDSVQDGYRALLIGDLIRSLLRAIALGHFIAWLAGWTSSLAPTSEWLRGAKTLPFTGRAKKPRLISIASLAARSAKWESKMVTIEGLLGKVKIVHRGGKAISSAPVSDANGKSVTIAIPYIKLDSGGMAPGAYVRVTGVWQEHNKETNGPALQIDRLNFGELGKTSWSDWATAELRSILTPVPHSLAASWSWEPGTDGAGNQLRYGTWFVNQERSK